jgi:hypothetical protein
MIRRWEVRSYGGYTRRSRYRIKPCFMFESMAIRYAAYLNILAAIEGQDIKFYVKDRRQYDSAQRV